MFLIFFEYSFFNILIECNFKVNIFVKEFGLIVFINKRVIINLGNVWIKLSINFLNFEVNFLLFIFVVV